METEESITSSIIKAKKSIRKKLQELKRGVDDTTEFIRKHASPIVEPLEEIAQQSKKFFNNRISNNSEENDDGDKNETVVLTHPLQLQQPQQSNFDAVYGVTVNDNGEFKMGDKTVIIDEHMGNIKVGSLKQMPLTEGLHELLFKKTPNTDLITSEDLLTYKNCLIHTRAHRTAKGRLKTNQGYKYKNIIKQLFSARQPNENEKFGGGLPFLSVTNKRKEYVYWDDINELVERLAILHASKRAGNTGVNNEIISLEEELRENGVIE